MKDPSLGNECRQGRSFVRSRAEPVRRGSRARGVRCLLLPRASFSAAAPCVLLALVAGAAWADDDAVLMDETVTVEVIAAPEEDRRRDALSPTAITSRVPIERAEAMTVELGAALRKVPGVGLRRTGSPGSPVNLSIRGSAADQVVVTLAGLPLTPPGGGPVDLSALSPTLLDELVVTRGTEGAMHGAGALGGVLHLEPMGEPRYEDPARPRRTWLMRGDSLASAGTAVAWRGREGNARVAAALDLHASAGRFRYERILTPNLPEATPVSEDRINNGAVLGSGLISAEVPAASGSLRLTGFGHRARHEVAGMVGFPTPGARSRTSRMLLGGAFEADPAGARALRWTAAAWVGGDRYDYDPGSLPAPGAGTGFETARQVVGLRSSVEALAAGTLLRIDSQATVETLTATAVDAGRTSGSISLSDTAFLFGDLLELHGALRLDAFSGLDAALSPRAGLRVRLPASLALVANVGRGVRMPALFELFGETALISSNEDLRPESALTVDLGLEFSRRELWSRLVAWHSRYQDLIAYELYPPMRLRPLNVGDALINGVEAEAGWAPASWLQLTFAYTLTDASNLSPAPNATGRELPYRPRHRGLGGVKIDTGRFSFHTELEAQSAYPRNRANTKWIPARLLLEAGAGVELGRGLFASLLFTNLLDDRRLEDLFGYPLPGRAAFVVVGFEG